MRAKANSSTRKSIGWVSRARLKVRRKKKWSEWDKRHGRKSRDGSSERVSIKKYELLKNSLILQKEIHR